jgi:hypothetical protein
VPTLEETLASQRDLSLLCAERELVTHEAFPPNAFYGMADVLKRYCGLSPGSSLKAVVPHGVYLSDSYLWEQEAQALVPAVLCYPPYRGPAYIRGTTKKVILSASPYLYAAALLQTQPPPLRRGTMFFPVHSTHWITALAGFEEMAEDLVNLEEDYQPVTVCMYWRDINLGRHVPFRERGLPVVCAGHMFGDPDFLYRMYHLCSLHRYASGNGMGTHLLYAVKAGCSYFDLAGHDYSYGIDPADYSKFSEEERRDSQPTVHEMRLASLFSQRRPSMSEEQLKAVDYYLGARYFKSPRGLREQLLYAEALDKAGFAVNVSGRTQVVVPTHYRRLYRRLLVVVKPWLPASARELLRSVLRRGRKDDLRAG